MLHRLKKAWNQSLNQPRKTPPPPEGWCPICGHKRLPNCVACRGAGSQPALDNNLNAFNSRRAFADSEVMAVIGHLRYASPAVQQEFRILLGQLLADDHSHGIANVTLGMAAANTIGDTIST